VKRTRQTITTIVSGVISLAVIVYLVGRLDWQASYQTFTHLNWGWLLAAWLIFLLNYTLRTLRFQLLFHGLEVPFRPLFSVTSLHGMFNYLMPAKSGEFSFLFLLKRRLRVSLSRSTAILLVVRFFDLATIALFLPTVLVAFWQRLPASVIYVSLIFSALIYILGGGVLWLLRKSTFAPAAAGGAGRPASGWAARLQLAWQELVEGIRLIDQRGQYGRLWLLTTGIWLCVYANFYFIVLSMGYRFTFIQMVVVSIIMVPMTLLPVQGVANLGSHEVGWIIALSLFGQYEEAALAIAVGSHVILLLFVLLLGGLGLLLGSNFNWPRAAASSRGVDG